MSAIGPLGSEQEARQLAAVQATYEAMGSGKPGAMAPANLKMLLDALVEAVSSSARTSCRSWSGWPGGSRPPWQRFAR
jgi:hypothetical protein